MEAISYRFLHRYLEGNSQPHLSLKQVDPFDPSTQSLSQTH
jgi:hypothetical protein